MADQDIILEVKVETGEAAKSLRQLKNEYKEGLKGLEGLTKGSKDYIAQLEKLGGIKDDIGDLNSEIKAFNPEGKMAAFTTVIGGLASGFQAAQGAAALFGNSGEEVLKTLLKVQAVMAFTEGIKGIAGLKDGFTVLGNVIKSNPIYLIGSIIIGIGTALFALKDKIGIVGDAFDFLGDIIGKVVQGGKDFLDFLGLTDFAMQKTSDSIINSANRIKNAVTSRYDSEIAAAKAAGKATELIEIAKLIAINKTYDVQIAQLRAMQSAGKELTEDQLKQLDELTAARQKNYQDINALNAQDNVNRAAAKQKNIDSYKDEHKEYLAIRKKYFEDMASLEAQKIETQRAFDAQKLADEKAVSDASIQIKDDEMSAKTAADQKAHEAKMAGFEKEAQTNKDTVNGALTLAKVSNDGMMALSDLYFDSKKKNLKKGSAEEKKVAKEQFEVNKKLSLVNATIMGIQSVIAAYQSGAAVPVVGVVLGPAMAILAGIAAASNISKIANSTFEGGASAPDAGGGGGSVSAPVINPPSSNTTQINADGTVNRNRQQDIKVNVLENDISQTQNRVNVIEQGAKL